MNSAHTPEPLGAISVQGPIVVAGATGYIGRFVAEAALAAGLPTYVLCRPGSTKPSKAATIETLKEKGATIVEGYVNDKEWMMKKLREFKIEVVVSVIGGPNILDQLPLIEAIQAVETVKRFLPSEFGNDIDRANPIEPGIRVYKQKRKVRRAVEAAGIPYTYICCNSIAGWPYFGCHHAAETTPPLDRVQIYADGNTKAYYVTGYDIGKFAVKAAYDERAAGKSVHFRPLCNFLSMNELASLWENKIERALQRVTISEEELLSAAAENRIPESFIVSFLHDVYINGCQFGFTIDGRSDVEVSDLYPDVPFRTMSDWLDGFVADVSKKHCHDNKLDSALEKSTILGN